MRVLIDANIVLDVLQKREPHYIDSAKVWKLCETEQVEGFISTLTFANLMYIMRKELSPEMIEDVLKKLALIFRFADFRECDIKDAVKWKWDDFEDSVQAVIASRLDVKYIVTRNVKDFKLSKVMAVTPAELLARI